METIIQKFIQGNTAKLVLGDDGVTVEVLYGSKVLSSSAGATYRNLCDAEMLEEYLDLVVEEHIKEDERIASFEEYCKTVDWGDKC